MKYKLNLGRNCLKMIIRTYGIKNIFIPYYSCKTIWKAARQENCNINFYHINQEFMPAREFDENDYILYINYFGLFEDNVKKLTQKYRHIIIDNTQSFYSKPTGLASFNSLRKFFPVQNGAYLEGINAITEGLQTDNLNLKSASIRDDYEVFRQNELTLDNEDVKIISPEVEKFMSDFDFANDKKLRKKLFKNYSEIFDKENLIKLPELKSQIPFCYPFCTKNENFLKKIEKNDIKIVKLWDKIPKDFPEYEFLNNVGAFPLTDEQFAQKIIRLCEEY